MAEWLIERGIGEDRAALLDQGEIIASRIHWTGELAAGSVVEAKLISRMAGSARGTVQLNSGEQALIDRLPKSAAEGSTIKAEIIRSAIGERGRLKMAQLRPSDAPLRNLDLAGAIESAGHSVKEVRRFPDTGWDEMISDALSREILFDGGALLFAPTPAMIVVDIDGKLPASELAMAAVKPLAKALRRFDISGMIGIDFPTIESRAQRKSVDDALSDALADWPHERTAMNGFGFVQLVARLERPSLVHRTSHSRTGLLARQSLRRAEMVEGAGAIELRVHPALSAKLKPDWLTELARRTGREVRIATDPALALEGGFAQAVPI